MGKLNKIYAKVMDGQSDANLSFDDLGYLLQKAGI